jgi:hypothetical protein
VVTRQRREEKKQRCIPCRDLMKRRKWKRKRKKERKIKGKGKRKGRRSEWKRGDEE